MLKPTCLDDAKNILNKVANNPSREPRNLLQSASDLNEKAEQFLDIWDIIFNFCEKVGYVFREINYMLTHPCEVLAAIEPWLVTALLVMLIMKVLGFDDMKYFKLVFVIIVLIIMFC